MNANSRNKSIQKHRTTTTLCSTQVRFLIKFTFSTNLLFMLSHRQGQLRHIKASVTDRHARPHHGVPSCLRSAMVCAARTADKFSQTWTHCTNGSSHGGRQCRIAQRWRTKNESANDPRRAQMTQEASTTGSHRRILVSFARC